MSYFLKKFINQEKNIYITEFGHSTHKQSKTVGPWSREIYILHYIAKGFCDFSGFKAEVGQAFLISKGHQHSFTVSDDYEHYWIGFNGNSVEAMFEKFGLTSTMHQLFFVEHKKFAELLFDFVFKELKFEDATNCESVVLSLFNSMIPLLKKEIQSETNYGTNYAEKVRLFIETNYIYPIKMSEIAKDIYISEKYMYRLFVRSYGISPQKFLLQTRMNAAKKLLLQRKFLVKEVALSVGYTSIPSFSKAFSNYFGTNPASFLKNSNNKNAHLYQI